MTVDLPAFLTTDLDPNPVDAYRQAWLLLQEREPRRAIALLDPALDAQPQSTSLRTLLAWATSRAPSCTAPSPTSPHW
jgi:predicted Zn-dependent protease